MVQGHQCQLDLLLHETVADAHARAGAKGQVGCLRGGPLWRACRRKQEIDQTGDTGCLGMLLAVVMLVPRRRGIAPGKGTNA